MDIFTGINFTISYNDDVANRSPQNSSNVEIDSIAAFPSLSIQSSTSEIETYDGDYTTKLMAEQAVDDFEIVVNYMPDNTTHMFLDNMVDKQTEFQVILKYHEDDESIQYAIVNGTLVSTSVNGDKDQVLSKSYRFSTTELVQRSTSIELLKPIYEGDFGVGANGDDVPQYQPVVATGNSFIKIPASQGGNPLGSDMMGIGLIDNGSYSALGISKAGALALFIKNGSTAWTRIYTGTQMDARYVPLTRTVNGIPLSANISLTNHDIGLGDVVNAPQLKIASNLSDLDNVSTARTNLDVYSKSEVSDNYVSKTTTVNGKGLSTDIVLSKSDIGLANVTNDAQLKIASNLSDLANVATARTNLGLGTAAVVNTGTSGAVIPLLSTANTWSGVQTFSGSIVGSITGTASNVTGTVAIANGGTGATTAATARTNLGLGTAATVNTGTSGTVIPLLSAANTWSGVQAFSSTITGSISGNSASSTKLLTSRLMATNLSSTTAASFDGTAEANLGVFGTLGIGNGGTGANSASQARVNLGLGSAAIFNQGTAGGTVPLLSGTNTWSGEQTFLGTNNHFGSVITIGSASGFPRIEMGRIDGNAVNTFIDMHSSGSDNDFDVRIQSSGGSSTDGQGVCTIVSSALRVNGSTVLLQGDYGLGSAGASFSMNSDQMLAYVRTAGSGFFRNNTSTTYNDSYAASVLARSADTWTLIGASYNGNGVRVAAGTQTTTAYVYELWTSRNTTVDTNNFIKRASPIIRLTNDVDLMLDSFTDGFEVSGCAAYNSEAEGIHAERTSTGVYKITGTEGLYHDGWTIEIPQDINGNRLCFVETEYDSESKALTIKVYKRKFDGETGEFTAGVPMNIPDARWIDLRVEMPEDSIYKMRQE